MLEENLEEYETAKEDYQKETKKEMTLYEFQEATSIFIINQEDGKTYLCENGENTAVWIEEIYQKIDLIRAEENVNARIENRDQFVLYKNVLKSCRVKVR